MGFVGGWGVMECQSIVVISVEPLPHSCVCARLGVAPCAGDGALSTQQNRLHRQRSVLTTLAALDIFRCQCAH